MVLVSFFEPMKSKKLIMFSGDCQGDIARQGHITMGGIPSLLWSPFLICAAYQMSFVDDWLVSAFKPYIDLHTHYNVTSTTPQQHLNVGVGVVEALSAIIAWNTSPSLTALSMMACATVVWYGFRPDLFHAKFSAMFDYVSAPTILSMSLHIVLILALMTVHRAAWHRCASWIRSGSRGSGAAPTNVASCGSGAPVPATSYTIDGKSTVGMIGVNHGTLSLNWYSGGRAARKQHAPNVEDVSDDEP